MGEKSDQQNAMRPKKSPLPKNDTVQLGIKQSELAATQAAVAYLDGKSLHDIGNRDRFEKAIHYIYQMECPLSSRIQKNQ
jgi:hypothetical protein